MPMFREHRIRKQLVAELSAALIVDHKAVIGDVAAYFKIPTSLVEAQIPVLVHASSPAAAKILGVAEPRAKASVDDVRSTVQLGQEFNREKLAAAVRNYFHSVDKRLHIRTELVKQLSARVYTYHADVLNRIRYRLGVSRSEVEEQVGVLAHAVNPKGASVRFLAAPADLNGVEINLKLGCFTQQELEKAVDNLFRSIDDSRQGSLAGSKRH
ncbi:MAG: hypothetical protein JW834_03220 [Candidatus Diapherotrites archaeon]|nr:hypothetical protein [Candidatus Diapherotrites archaeon]